MGKGWGLVFVPDYPPANMGDTMRLDTVSGVILIIGACVVGYIAIALIGAEIILALGIEVTP